MVFDPAALEHVIQGGTSRVLAPTTGDEVITLQFHTLKTRSTHSHTLLGRVAGEEETSDVIVVYHDGVIHGSIARYADIIDQHLEYRILTDGHMMVRELDPTTMTARCGNGPDTEMADEIFDDITHDGFEIILQKEGEKTEESSDTADWRTVDSGIFSITSGNPMVIAQSPTADSHVENSVSQLSLTFSHAMEPASFVIEDSVLSFTGPAGLVLTSEITSASWSGQNTILTLGFTTQSTPGTAIPGSAFTNSPAPPRYRATRNGPFTKFRSAARPTPIPSSGCAGASSTPILETAPPITDGTLMRSNSPASSASPPPWVTHHHPAGMAFGNQSSIWFEFSQPMDTGGFSLGDIESFANPFFDVDPATDFDGGGLANALEWVLGADPTDPGDDAFILPTNFEKMATKSTKVTKA